jgi:inosine/xanthosine triphosphatase
MSLKNKSKQEIKTPNKFVIAVGTTSSQKLDYVKKVLNKLKLKYKILPVEVSSGISDQPTTSQETRRGSVNRAKEAFRKTADADFSIGIEVGYHLKKHEYEMFCWVTIYNKKNTVSQISHSFVLPDHHQKVLKRKQFLGDHVADYYENSTDNLKQHVGKIIRYREPFITSALEYSLLKFSLDTLF